MAKKIINEIKNPHKSYIGRIIYKEPFISFPFQIGGGYFAELEDTRTNKKIIKKIGYKEVEWTYPFHRYDVKIESMEFVKDNLEIKCSGSGRYQDKITLSKQAQFQKYFLFYSCFV